MLKSCNRKKSLIVLFSLLILLLLIATKMFILPAYRYNCAVKALNAGSKEQALSLFMKSYRYKDSMQYIRQLSRSMQVVAARP